MTTVLSLLGPNFHGIFGILLVPTESIRAMNLAFPLALTFFGTGKLFDFTFPCVWWSLGFNNDQMTRDYYIVSTFTLESLRK